MARPDLSGMRIASLVAEDFEDNELWYPTFCVRAAGAEVPLVGQQTSLYHGKYGVPAQADLDLSALQPDQFDGVLVPGGWAPDKLRRYPEVTGFIKTLHDHGKLCAFICHAGWIAVSAHICGGHTMTSTPAIKDDLTYAGATWVDQETVVCGNVITARRPDDLPAYGNAIVDFLTAYKGD